MPQELNEKALSKLKTVTLPAAKPPEIDQETGEITPGRLIPGDLPMRDIPHQDFPRIVYLHPKKPWKKMLLPVDGHGNKEWQWVANEAKTRKVADEKELNQARKEGYKVEMYVTPPSPAEDPEEETVEVSK